jgi:uncharacterized membrane protein
MLKVLAIFALLFAPSAWFVWENRDMPNFDFYHDDGVYFASAKSLAQTGSYRLESLPGTPTQTKYPPVLSLWHSITWMINPEFPANLGVAIWLQWIWLPAFAFLAYLLSRDWGLAPFQRWLLVVGIALSPYPLFFSTAILSEIPFGVLLLACLLCLGRGYIWAAAILGGLAFLTRTAGVVLLGSVPIVFLLQKKRRESIQFVVAMLPFVVGWFLWSKANRAPANDAITQYYVDYLGYHFRVFSWPEAHLFLWRNADQIIQSAGAFLLPVVYPGQIAKITTQVFGVAAIVGAVRLARTKPQAQQFGVFALLSVAVLLLWSFPPNERFLLPLAPLIIAGMIVEFTRIAQAMRISFKHKEKSQRTAGYIIATVATCLIAFCIYTELAVRFEMMPAAMDSERTRANQRKPMYEWISRNTTPETKILAGYDAALYLSTGRRSAHLILDPIHWYREEKVTPQQQVDAYTNTPGYDMILWTPYDRRNDVDSDEQVAVGRALASSKSVQYVQEFPNISLMRIISRPPNTPAERSPDHR